jgi:hypothetical protein
MPLSAGDGEFLLRSLGDRLQRTYGRLDVVDVELAEQLSRRSGDVLAQAAIQGFPFRRQVDLRVAADQVSGLVSRSARCWRRLAVIVRSANARVWPNWP